MDVPIIYIVTFAVGLFILFAIAAIFGSLFMETIWRVCKRVSDYIIKYRSTAEKEKR